MYVGSYIWSCGVKSFSEECIPNQYSPYERELKEIKSCTKGRRPLLIGATGHYRWGVLFLSSSFKTLIPMQSHALFLAISWGLTLVLFLFLHFTEFSPLCVECGDL